MCGLVLETPRLRLRNFTEYDIPQLVSLIGARDVATTTLRIPHPYTEEDAKEFICGCSTSPDVALAVILRSEERLCGGVGLRPNQPHRRAELGYWIGVPYWGNGYATEAAGAMIRHGFQQLQLNRIFASHFKQNVASGRVLMKLGMRHEGCMRQHVLKWGKFVDLEVYSIVREEWLAQGSRVRTGS